MASYEYNPYAPLPVTNTNKPDPSSVASPNSDEGLASPPSLPPSLPPSARGTYQNSVTLNQQQAMIAQLRATTTAAQASSGAVSMPSGGDFDPKYNYSANGPVNWKLLWNSLLSGQQNNLRKWVNELPIKGCKIDGSGYLDVSQSVIPPAFTLQLAEMLSKAVPPLGELVIDALCWRGIFLPNEIEDFDLLSVRLARNLLLLRPAGKRENKPLSLEKFLPFGSLSKFHRYMLTTRLKRYCYQHQPFRRSYITWYKLADCMAEIDPPEVIRKRLVAPPNEKALQSQPEGGEKKLEEEKEQIVVDEKQPEETSGISTKHDPIYVDLSEKGVIDPAIGEFVQGSGYVVSINRADGTTIYGSEEAGLAARKEAQAAADAIVRREFMIEIEGVQFQVAEELVKANFEYEWLKMLGIPHMKVHPLHIYHDHVSRKLNDEIDSLLPKTGASNVLGNTPSDQILMLILFLIYKNSCTRAIRISVPLLQSNPGVMYPYLSTLVCKVAISCCAVQTKSNKRNQANCLGYLKMVQEYVNGLPGNAKDGSQTVHGLPNTQNYPLFLSLFLDFSAILQRYMSMSEIMSPGMLSGLDLESLPVSDRTHFPSLLWRCFDALIRRRNSRLESAQGRHGHESDGEREQDGMMITWILGVGMKLFKLVSQTKKVATEGAGASAVVAAVQGSDNSTILYILLGLHILYQEPFPRGFSEALKLEQGEVGPLALFTQMFLWFSSLSQEQPMFILRRVLELYDSGFFDGGFIGYMTSASDDRDFEAMKRDKYSLNGSICLEHLCLALAPYSSILLAAKFPDVNDGSTTVMTVKQRQEFLLHSKPVWDSTSESLLRIAYDPITLQHILKLSLPARASYLLSKCGGDEVLITLACGIGATQGDCLLAWLRRNQPDLLQNLPELPPPGPVAPDFETRSLPLEKALLRLTRAGCWYTLLNGLKIYAPNNILYSVILFLKYFTQRRYILCATTLNDIFHGLKQTQNLQQPEFGRAHFFAVINTGNPQMAEQRNQACWNWTARLVVQLLRNGLLIGMQGNIPSSHRMVGTKDIKQNAGVNQQGFTSIDLTDYDRNFLMDIFGDVLKKYGTNHSTDSDTDGEGETNDTYDDSLPPVFSLSMMNDILSIIPPTVSASFLLNITSIQTNVLSTKKQSHRSQFKEHRYRQWKSRLSSWKDHESYYTRKVNEVIALLDLEVMVGVSLNERERFIRYLYLEMYELEVMPGIRAAIWYQVSQYFYKSPHTQTDSLHEMKSNSSAEAAQLGTGAHLGNAHASHAAIIAAQHAHAPVGSQAAEDNILTGSGSKAYEHVTEKEEAEQEMILLYLALENWEECLRTVDEELETYFRSNPRTRPTPKLINTPIDGKQVVSENEFTLAIDPSTNKPYPLPQEIMNGLQSKSQYQFVIARLRGRIYWLMVLHGLNNPRDIKLSQITYDLNDPDAIQEWKERRKEREQRRTELETERMVRRAAKEANAATKDITTHQRTNSTITGSKSSQSALTTGEGDDLPPLPPSSPTPDSHHHHHHHRSSTTHDLRHDLQELNEEEEDDELFQPLIIDFMAISQAHLNVNGTGVPASSSGRSASAGSGGSISGMSYGLEKFHILHPSQYLPWNGSASSLPTTAVQEAALKHRAIAVAFDEDMDITRLTKEEIRLLGEHSIDTKFVLALVEELIHTRQFRSALCVITDILDRFPSVRNTPRMQAACGLCDMLQFLFWLAHPTLQDVRINTVLSGSSGAPFAGPNTTTLTLSEECDPFAACYKQLLAWPVVPHLLREEDQTWMRMRWYHGTSSDTSMSNQTLMLQRLLIDSVSGQPSSGGSVYQKLLLNLLLSNDKSGGISTTVYSRTRPVGVEVKPNTQQDEGASTNSGGVGALANTLFGTMKTIGAAIKVAANSVGENPAPASNSSHPSESSSLDVEDLRQWLLTLDEAGRVELLDRFVTLANTPLSSPLMTNTTNPSGLTAAVSDTTSSSTHSLVHESYNTAFTSLTLRHLPLLCEISQFLAIAVRVTKIELTKPKNKKLNLPDPLGVRMTSQHFLNALASILVKTRVMSVRWPSTIPLHYASRTRLEPDSNSPTTPWMLNLAENLGRPLTELLTLHPQEFISILWNGIGNQTHTDSTSGIKAHGLSERSSISTLLHSGQIYYHFINHPSFFTLDREVTGVDLSAALVETFMNELKLLDQQAGPPSPFTNFQLGAWWTREEYLAFLGLADRTESLALPTLAAAFRAQAFVLIKARDPNAAVSSSLLAEHTTAASLLGWWTGPKESDRPYLHSHGAGEFIRLQPGRMIEFELLHASYLCYLSAGRTFEMRQVANDLRSGLQDLLTSVMTKSKTPAPPIISSPTNPNETIAPPFPGASLQQIEQIFLARLQLERCSHFLNNSEMRTEFLQMWRAFKRKAPTTFA